MKKSIVLGLGLSLCVLPGLVQAKELPPVDVLLNGEYLPLVEESVILKDNRTFLPLRVISEELGYKVDWIQDKQEVVLSQGDKQVEMILGKKEYTVNTETKKMDVAPFTKGDRTYVPVRAFEDSLGLKLAWDEANRMVRIGHYPKSEAYEGEERIQFKSIDMSLIIPEKYKDRILLVEEKDRVVFYDKLARDFFMKRDGMDWGYLGFLTVTDKPRENPNFYYCLDVVDGHYYYLESPGEPQGEEGLNEINASLVETHKMMEEILKTVRVTKGADKDLSFNQAEIDSAIQLVKDEFVFPGSKLTKVWYDEGFNKENKKFYLENGRGLITKAKAENVIILLSDFVVGDPGPGSSLNPNSNYDNYQWVLIRDSKGEPWRIDDQGY